jgi:uncharacterized GH25 family protein
LIPILEILMRTAFAIAAFVLMTNVAHAHWVFVYVPENQSEAHVVFGHAAAPDPKLFPTRAEKTELAARDAAGKTAKLTMEKGDGNFYRAKFSGKPAILFGTTAGGVVQRGDNPASLSWYYPKTILGDPFAEAVTIGKDVPLELVPERDGDKVRFKVLSDGKPLADAEVTVVPPGKGEEESAVVKTDKDGRTTGFADRGRFCVAVRRIDEKPGESEGKKYTIVRHTATLVFDFAGRAK